MGNALAVSSSVQTPLPAGVGYAEAFALGVTLRIAGRLRDHHGKIAAVIMSIAHAFAHQSGLQPTASQLWHRRRTAEKRYSIVYTEHAGSARLTIHFGKEANAPLTSGRDGSELQEKIHKLRMVVRPSSRADVVPELRFFRPGDSNPDIAGVLSGLRVDRTIEDIADLDRSV